MIRTVDLVKAPQPETEGVHDPADDVTPDAWHPVAEDVRKHFGDVVLSTVIPRSVRLEPEATDSPS